MHINLFLKQQNTSTIVEVYEMDFQTTHILYTLLEYIKKNTLKILNYFFFTIIICLVYTTVLKNDIKIAYTYITPPKNPISANN